MNEDFPGTSAFFLSLEVPRGRHARKRSTNNSQAKFGKPATTSFAFVTQEKKEKNRHPSRESKKKLGGSFVALCAFFTYLLLPETPPPPKPRADGYAAVEYMPLVILQSFYGMRETCGRKQNFNSPTALS